MEYTLQDLINLEMLRRLMEDFYDAYGVHCSIVDQDFNLLIGVGWSDICTDFHRKNPETCALCEESDAQVFNHLREGRYYANVCANGLVDAAFPIMIDGERLGAFFFGQFLHEPPDETRFREQAERFGFDLDDYMAATKRIPIYSKERLSKIMACFDSFVTMLTDLGRENLDRRRAELALKESERNYARLIQTTVEGYWRTDLEYRILDVNDAMCRLLGYPREEILGRRPHDFTDRNNRAFLDEQLKMLTTTRHASYLLTMRRKSGEPLNVLCNRTTLLDEHGEVQGGFALLSDITETVRAKEELAELNKNLEQLVTQRTRELAEAYEELRGLDTMKSRLLTSISHELRTPLTSLVGFTKLSRRKMSNIVVPGLEHTDDKQVHKAVHTVAQNLTTVEAEAANLARLLENSIDMARLVSGDLEPMLGPTMVEVVLRAAMKRHTIQARAKGLSLEFFMAGDAPEEIVVDDRLLGLVVSNLIANAVRFTDQGGVVLRVEPDNSGIRVTVSDTGPGIALEDQTAVFKRFHQLGDMLTDKPPGLGIGLSLCKEIVDRFGGRIWLESEPGKGSEFSFTVPAMPLEGYPGE